MKRTALFVFLALFLTAPAGAAVGDLSPDGIWAQVDGSRTGLTPSLQLAKTQALPTFQLDPAALDAALRGVPHEDDVAVTEGKILSLPLPDGTYSRFHVVESPILSPELQAEHPEIRTFLGQGIDDPTATLRADQTLFGFRSAILSATGRVYIDPVEMGNTDYYVSYTKADVAPGEFVCGVSDADAVDVELDVAAIPVNGATRREYSLVVQLTGEYTVFFGGSTNAFNASTTTWNRVNQIYERDLAVRLVLAGQQSWPDPATDPYPTGSTVNSTLLNQAQAQNDATFGAGNYDVGHILTQGGGGGLAQLSVVCGASKSRGGTGRPNPVGDPFDIDYVAHEVGHQYGASHTFNGTTSSCGGGNRSASNAYEPGSGTTIMAYAGICGAENVQSNSDALFHVRSLEQIISFLGTTACQTNVATGNTPPVANAGLNFSIPRGTPYRLYGSGSDANGDAMTYVWEQYDLGAASPPTDPFGPLVRSLLPSTSSTRIVPNMTDLLAGSYSWEMLPTVDRSMHFRLTVRDNRAASGGVDDDEVLISVTGAPFFVNFPNGSETVEANELVTVTWTPGGGAALSANVNILLSVNGGSSWSFLAAATPNDGSQQVQMPCSGGSTQARIMIESTNGRFFDVSNGNFTIQDTRPDYVNAGFTGWDDALVPRPTADATSASVLFPTSLTGDATSYLNYSYRNFGNGIDPNGTLHWYRVYFDGVLHAQYHDSPRAVNSGGFILNSARAVSGGRHVFEAIVDEDDDICETNEFNNAYARQFVWSPVDLPVETMMTRAGPPPGDAGWASLSASGYPIEWNADGMGFPVDVGQTYWNAVGLHAASLADNVDIALMFPHTDIFTGFDVASWTGLQSLLGAGLTDIMIVNRNMVGGDFELELVNFGGPPTGDYRVEHRGAPLAVYTVPAQETVPMAQSQMLFMRELWVADSQDLTISADVVGAAQPVQLAFFDAAFGIGLPSDALAQVVTDPSGHGEFTVSAVGGNHYGILVYRHPVDGESPIDVTVKVRGPVQVTANTAAAGPVSIFSAPDGSGKTFLQAWSWDGVPGSTPVAVDATVGVIVEDAGGNPIPSFPQEDIRLVTSAGGLKGCAPGNIADADTDGAGATQFQNALEAGGYSGASSLVLYDCPMVASGDGTTRGFYVPSWPGATLDEVELHFSATVAGSYDMRLTVREATYDGPVIGTSDITVSGVGAFPNSVPATFPFTTAMIAPGTTVTFALTQLSGPGGAFYDIPADDPACGIVQTNGTAPPLDTFRRNGVRTRILGSTAAEVAQIEIVGVPSQTTTYGGGGSGLEIFFNSADISGDLAVNLTDLGLFAFDFGGTAYRSDFQWDGVINLSDLGLFAFPFGSACGAPREAIAMGMPRGAMSVAYDLAGKQRGAAAQPGRPFDAYLLVEGEAARRGVNAWEGAFETSDNLKLVDVVLGERGLNVGHGTEYHVGLGETRSHDDGPVILATLKLEVTNTEPAYLYLRPTELQSAGYAPAVVLGDGTLAPMDVSSVVDGAVLAINDGSVAEAPVAFVYAGPNLRNNPNPFNPSTQIRFDLPREGRADVAIYDVAGRLVTRLDGGRLAAGPNALRWNGTDHRGEGVTSGVYYYRLFLDGEDLGATGRMSLLK